MTNDFGGGRLSRTPLEGMGFPPIFFELHDDFESEFDALPQEVKNELLATNI